MRTDYCYWSHEFFGLAYQAAMRSKDPSTQCGACIVKDNRPIGVGYNGLIRGMRDSVERWEKEEKKKYVIHAEINAIANSNTFDFNNSEIFIWTSNKKISLPCDGCARLIVQFGIKKVNVLDHQIELTKEEKERWKPDLTLELFSYGEVELKYYPASVINQKLLDLAVKNLQGVI